MSVATRQQLAKQGQEAWEAAQAIIGNRSESELSEEERKAVDSKYERALQFKEMIEQDAKRERLDAFYDDPQIGDRLAVKGMALPGALGDKQVDPQAAQKMIQNMAFRKALHQTPTMRSLRDRLSPDEYKALSSMRAEDGGYATSEDFRNDLIMELRDRTVIRERAKIISTSKGTVGFPSFDFDGELSTVLESEELPEVPITEILGKTTFTPHTRGGIFRCPVELVEDQDYDLTGLLIEQFALQFGQTEENDFLNGTGANQPFGILRAPISGTSASGGGADVTPEDIVRIPYDVRAVYRSNGTYMMHREMIKVVRSMRTNDDGANTGAFLWQPSFQAGQPATLNGYPLLESEFFPNKVESGAEGDPLILFGDWTQYWIVDRTDLSVKTLDQLYAKNNQIGYQLTRRYDGAPVELSSWKRINRAA